MRLMTASASALRSLRNSQRGLSGKKSTPTNMTNAGSAMIPSITRQWPPIMPPKLA